MTNVEWLILGLFLGALLTFAYYNFKDVKCICLKNLNIFGKKEMQSETVNYQNWDGLNPIDTDSI